MKKYNCHSLIVLGFILLTHLSHAGEGMWLPFLLSSLNEAEMKSMGMKMSADDIYSVNHGSLKDAVVHFGGFCTADVVSDQGLLFTNHHCGYAAIQAQSSVEHNYLIEGYWAKSLAEEKPNPGLYATFIIRIEDVTSQIVNGITPDMNAAQQQSVIDKNISAAKSAAPRESWQDAFIKPFFEGNRYFLFVTETYNDVRYVGSPPESIGKFGADTDNWVWPRHTGDFSVFRIYAGPDNKPANYSPDNKPYKPRHFFPLSLDGVAEGDFTLIFGFPGKTTEYLPSFAIQQTMDIIDPARIEVRDISLGVMNKYMRANENIRLAYSAKYASLANSWKKWIGEEKGLRSKTVVSIKEAQESDFTQRLKKDAKWNETYGHLLPDMRALYAELEPIIKTRTILAEVIGGNNIELFKLAALCDRLTKAFIDNGEKGYRDAVTKTMPMIDAFYKDYYPEVDREVYDGIMAYLQKAVSENYLPDQLMIDQTHSGATKGLTKVTDITKLTALSKKETFLALISQPGQSFMEKLELDQGYKMYAAFKKILDMQVSPSYTRITDQLNALQKNYMKALMEVYPEKKFWPDANNTMRVAYGQVEPYYPKDGVMYKTQTYLDGVMEKYIPGDYEFDVSPKLIALYKAKDYGPYGENGKMPVCFIASNHTTGGNSGSPAIDAYGNLLGLNFDRVWEGTMSDLYYDRSISRNIMVDIRYVLFIIDKYAGATNLIGELKLVHPKAGVKSKKKKKMKAAA